MKRINDNLESAAAKLATLGDELQAIASRLRDDNGDELLEHADALADRIDAAALETDAALEHVHNAGSVLDTLNAMSPDQGIVLFVHNGVPCISTLATGSVTHVRRWDAAELEHELERMGYSSLEVKL